MIFYISDKEAYSDFKSYLVDDKPEKIRVIGNRIVTEEYTVEVEPEYIDLLTLANSMKTSDYDNPLIFGKDTTEGIVAIENKGNDIWLYFNDGTVEKRPAKFWICSSRKLDLNFKQLRGNNHYKYVRAFTDVKEYQKFRAIYNKKDIYVVWNNVESQMISKGITLFKGLKVSDVSVLSFDIEGSGLVRDKTSQVFVITNTLKIDGKTTIKQFREDEYPDQGQMIEAWCNWVREVDPTIINGHNVFGYDLDYLNHVAGMYGKKLVLGRDDSPAKFGQKPKKYRVDGSQTWDYFNCNIFGRHVIDGMFLAVKYDIGRKYPSWGLKPIAEHEGIVAKDRQFYDASQIGRNWSDLIEREKIVKYCEDDGNDSMALYELMIPSFFYMAQNIPKPFQTIVNSASGSWLNGILVRSYLQNTQSIPKASEAQYVAGGVSFGIPGVHDNVYKIDIKSMYPSIMRSYHVNDPKKDPDNNFFNLVDYFTIKRFEQKDMHKKTGDTYYDDLQASSKIFINSCYGMLGTPGLNFNSFDNADFVTGMGRQIIKETIKWATGKRIEDWTEYDPKTDPTYDGSLKVREYDSHDFVMVNADTDSISFAKKDGSSYGSEEMVELCDEINDILPDMIEYEDDGYFDRIVVVKAKNYVMKEGDKIKYKGSSFKDPKKEPALTEMMHKIIEDSLIYEKLDYADIYIDYVKETLSISDITRWAVKKSVTEKLFESDRANETKVVDAIGDKDVQIGDKIFLYSAIDGEKQKVVKGEPVFFKKTGEPKMIANEILRLTEYFNGDYNKLHYVSRVYKTIEIFKNVIDMDRITKYTLAKNVNLLEEL